MTRYMIAHMRNFQDSPIPRGKKYIRGYLGRNEKGMTTKGCKASFWGDKNVPQPTDVMVTHICEYTKNHRIANFNCRKCMVYVNCSY